MLFKAIDAEKGDVGNEYTEVAPNSNAELVPVFAAEEGSAQDEGKNGVVAEEVDETSAATAEAGPEPSLRAIEPSLPPRGDGAVTLKYEMYDEKFPIKVMITCKY